MVLKLNTLKIFLNYNMRFISGIKFTKFTDFVLQSCDLFQPIRDTTSSEWNFPDRIPGCFSKVFRTLLRLFTQTKHKTKCTFFLIMPVSPFSLKLASFSSLSRRSYLFLMSKISRSASSSICFFVSSYSRSCCLFSSCDCVKKATKFKT